MYSINRLQINSELSTVRQIYSTIDSKTLSHSHTQAHTHTHSHIQTDTNRSKNPSEFVSNVERIKHMAGFANNSMLTYRIWKAFFGLWALLAISRILMDFLFVCLPYEFYCLLHKSEAAIDKTHREKGWIEHKEICKLIGIGISKSSRLWNSKWVKDGDFTNKIVWNAWKHYLNNNTGNY